MDLQEKRIALSALVHSLDEADLKTLETFLEPLAKEDYNQEIDRRISKMEKGQVLSHHEVLNRINAKQWRKS